MINRFSALGPCPPSPVRKAVLRRPTHHPGDMRTSRLRLYKSVSQVSACRALPLRHGASRGVL
eukprot:2066069-Prymnesium_polylepis.1